MEQSIPMSVIIPVGPNEVNLTHLNHWIEIAPGNWEWIVTAVKDSESEKILKDSLDPRFKVILGQAGRAKQMNEGAKEAQGRFLWFLHCDSSFRDHHIQVIKDIIRQNQKALWFFRLQFKSDGPPWMFLTELGTRIRSEYLKIPFGDQGFLLRQDLFWSLGAYDETASFGEDHLLVWQAHKQSIPVRKISRPLKTSARKYKDLGWSRVTKRHLRLTWQQAKPEFNEFLKRKFQKQ